MLGSGTGYMVRVPGYMVRVPGYMIGSGTGYRIQG